jgi:hypothetical protein
MIVIPEFATCGIASLRIVGPPIRWLRHEVTPATVSDPGRVRYLGEGCPGQLVRDSAVRINRTADGDVLELDVAPETTARAGDQGFVRIHRAKVFAETAR